MENKRKILIIEDNSDIQQLYKYAFEAGGYEVKTSSNGLDGLNDAIEYQPDVILLDIMMPEMNGFEVLSAFTTNTSLSMPIIITSNLSQESDKQKALTAGASLYLVKSDYEGPDLVAKVDEFMASHPKSEPRQNPAVNTYSDDTMVY
ncbi:MAG: response regulator [Candidatus Saccharibacteria bacterium]